MALTLIQDEVLIVSLDIEQDSKRNLMIFQNTAVCYNVAVLCMNSPASVPKFCMADQIMEIVFL